MVPRGGKNYEHLESHPVRPHYLNDGKIGLLLVFFLFFSRLRVWVWTVDVSTFCEQTCPALPHPRLGGSQPSESPSTPRLADRLVVPRLV